MELREQPPEAGVDRVPVAEPIAWKAEADLGRIERALVNAGAR
jgi:hypothetical protein